MSLWKFIKDKMLNNPKQLICENEAKMTYEELVVYAETLSKKLDGEKCCAILCKSEMAAGIAILACFAAKVTAVPLSMRYGEVHCKKIIDLIGPSCIITDFDSELQVYKVRNYKYIEPKETPALIMCTSGTTGTPKGVMLSEENIITNVKDISAYFGIEKKDSLLIARPLYHCAVLVGEFLISLIKGVKVFFYSHNFNPYKLVQLIVKNKISVFCSTPTLLNAITRFLNDTKEESLKHIVISGECMSKYIGNRIYETFPSAQIYHVYGQTEACPRISYLPPEYFTEAADCCGIPLKSVDVRIVNTKGEDVGVGETGELIVRGKNIMIGYYNDPELTSRVLRNEWLFTGDMASMQPQGWLKIKGRLDDLIIRAGMNIYPQEIEEELKKDNRTKDVLVYGIYNEIKGMQIGLKISGNYRSVKDVKELCMQRLAIYQVPTIIEIVEDIPKNSSGKIIRGNYYEVFDKD